MKYISTERLTIPFIGYGTGLVRPYTNRPVLLIRQIIRQVLASIKYLKLNNHLVFNFFAKKKVEQAYAVGYRLFDTGRLYGYSEMEMGKVLKKHKRDDYFIITKITSMDFQKRNAPADVMGNLKMSLKYLNVDYVDLYLLHHPYGDWIDIYKQIEQAKEFGLTKHIGVSNFKVEHFNELMKYVSTPPEVCQAECHPLCTNADVRDYCTKNDILFMAHTSTGGMRKKIRENKCLQELSAKYHKTIAQIILRWHYQNKVVSIISTTDIGHMKENLDIFDFELSLDEMVMIEAQNENYVILSTSNGPDDPNYIFNV
jgi:diketogulonate reductase-like aldo/keto reductase